MNPATCGDPEAIILGMVEAGLTIGAFIPLTADTVDTIDVIRDIRNERYGQAIVNGAIAYGGPAIGNRALKMIPAVDRVAKQGGNILQAAIRGCPINSFEAGTLISTPNGVQIPLKEVGHIERLTGPGMIRTENGLLAGYVFIDVTTDDIGGYVEQAKKMVNQKINMPNGYSLEWSGQYKSIERVRFFYSVLMQF